MKHFEALALERFPLVDAGDDIAGAIAETAAKNYVGIEDGDIVVVAQKIISKAERRIVRLGEVAPSKPARRLARIIGKSSRLVELVLRETKKVLKSSREILLVEDIHGLVSINAGIDKSNVKGKDSFALLPADPDASAKECRSRLKHLTGKNVAVVVCDTYSRPFRRAQVNFAIGIAGIEPFKDYRGKRDLFGQVLKVKNVAIVDEIACAAELLMGQAREATPVVILRGLRDYVVFSDGCSIRDVYISAEEDLFRNAL